MNTPRLLLITPPLTQLNTPYPATIQLCGFLRSQGVECSQMDLGIELIDRLYRADVLRELFRRAEGVRLPAALGGMVREKDFYIGHVEAVMDFLRGNNQSLATLFARPDYWPSTTRMPDAEDLEWAYGTAGFQEQAKLLCTLFVEDVASLFGQVISPHFQLIRYAEKLCSRLTDFGPLDRELHSAPNLIDRLMLELLDRRIDAFRPTHVGFSVPFPGNLYAALRCAAHIRERHPHILLEMGGGYVNTELRSLSDPRIFRHVDLITYDDGELPLLRWLRGEPLLRAASLRADGTVGMTDLDSTENIPFARLGNPCTDGLNYHLYLDTADSTNPMQRLWSNGRWNKMMLAHGCYWHRCTFCDTRLDYIGRFEQTTVSVLVDRMEAYMAQTGQSGFHFVDEAAPPALLGRLAEEILRRGLVVSWWTNIRFEQSYTAELCRLLARSGCIAVSGGLEVASARVLKLINKGITIESARHTLRHLTDAGIMVHAYLMYGFPTQTEGELFQSLGTVRDLFADGLVQSAFWHRYAMTCHSPSGIDPVSVGAVHVSTPVAPFANNEIPFTCPDQPDWSRYERGLNLATYNYMRGAGFDMPLRQWFKKPGKGGKA